MPPFVHRSFNSNLVLSAQFSGDENDACVDHVTGTQFSFALSSPDPFSLSSNPNLRSMRKFH